MMFGAWIYGVLGLTTIKTRIRQSLLRGLSRDGILTESV
jgi:hypothetical protein